MDMSRMTSEVGFLHKRDKIIPLREFKSGFVCSNKFYKRKRKARFSTKSSTLLGSNRNGNITDAGKDFLFVLF